VDYDIYRRFHPNKCIFDDRMDDLGEEAMVKDEPPDDEFLAMLPPEIHAFDLASKAWSKLSLFPSVMVDQRPRCPSLSMAFPDTSRCPARIISFCQGKSVANPIQF
jgi:hypothetical protein